MKVRFTETALREIDSIVADEPDVRIVPLGRYPHLVFYRVASEEIAILHVRHAARLPPR